MLNTVLTRALGALVLGLTAMPALASGPPAFESPLHRDHPLVGEIRSVRDGAALTPDQLAAALADSRYILLGEQHDNPDHHALQAWAVEAVATRGRKPAVAFEMIDRPQAKTLAGYLEANPKDAAGLGPALRWEDRGWPDWQMYQPIAAAALAHELPLAAANAGRELTRSVGRQGFAAMEQDRPARLALDRPLPQAQQAELQAELQSSHCNMLPEAALKPMANVQRLRDAVMADTLIASAEDADGAILIVGGGHVRADRGVPWYLRARLHDPTVAVVRFLEVAPGETDWRAYVPEAPADGPPVFDYVWFTPAVDHGDPCADFAEQIKQHGEKRSGEQE